MPFANVLSLNGRDAMYSSERLHCLQNPLRPSEIHRRHRSLYKPLQSSEVDVRPDLVLLSQGFVFIDV